MAQPIIRTIETAPAPLSVVGEEITVLASGLETGCYEVFFQAGPEGAGPPPHSHGWDECFYVVGGEVSMGVADETVVANAGTFVHVPAGAVHWFRFGPGGGQMLSVASKEGPARLFAEIDREVAGASDVAKLVEVGGRHGVAFHG